MCHMCADTFCHYTVINSPRPYLLSHKRTAWYLLGGKIVGAGGTEKRIFGKLWVIWPIYKKSHFLHVLRDGIYDGNIRLLYDHSSTKALLVCIYLFLFLMRR